MKTSSKYRRLVRQRKLRRQRSAALLVFIVLVVLVANVALSNKTDDSTKDVMPVVVHTGDTIWSIAKEYKPGNVDFSEYVHMITANNGIKDGNIYVGQTLYVPVG